MTEKRAGSWKRASLQIALLAGALALLTAWNTRDLLPVDERSEAPGWFLSDLQGQPRSLQELRGRPAVLYFFAPWCGVCAASSPQLRWFDRLVGNQVQLVMIGLDWDRPEELAEYAKRHSLENPVLLGTAATAADYRVRGYPTYYVIDSSGRIAGRDVGFTTVAGLWWRTRGL